ncbi:peptidyl-prolyl cis-trans isomerase [Dokdonia pacifica]|uniref:Peptidyl-prolyl cis-trans isomerase n=1 Tax=Dokdonia pacifica TaxID=1627892 RepID=A0A239EB31_9FLAO|nr:gliding motility-associated peptidyl-prolyl isomerase GldI [Dokdonia pacifica]GGG27698.1 peptidyl-prolyl cis-trans isomerase [Dokdonia pacifica]SNS41448.1 protein involved in gliding motility GldI [Dokdonia pacifica]
MKKGITFITIILCLLACKEPEARRPISQKTGSYITESIERNKELIAAEEIIIKKRIEKDTSTTYLSSESGFWYTYVTQDSTNTRTPKKGDIVNVLYDLQTLSGKTILSKEEIGVQAIKVDQSNQELISGIRDGIKLLKEGETITFLFPSHKAYGYYGFEDKIGSNIPIRSTVTLLSIKDNEPK